MSPAARRLASGGAVLLCAIVAALGAPHAARADGTPHRPSRRLCAEHVQLYNSPHGVVIGHLYAPQRVKLLGVDVLSHWWRIRTKADVIGWITPQTSCSQS